MPDTLLDRVRAADPVRPGEFAGLADFAALNLAPRRSKRRLLAATPGGRSPPRWPRSSSCPPPRRRRRRCVRRAVDAMALDDGGILYAQTSVRAADGDDYGTSRVWVQGDDVRWLQVERRRRGNAGDHARRLDSRATRRTAA